MISLDLHKESGVQLDLSKHDADLKNLRVLLNWGEHPVHAHSLTEGFDLDLWAFVLDKNDKAIGVVYFNNKDYENAIKLPRDNRTGEGDDDEEININLDNVPADVGSIVIYCFIFEADKRKQHFGMMIDANVQMINQDTGAVLAKYDITKEFNGQTALAIGSISGKTFTPEGTAGTMSPQEVLNFYQ